MKRELLHLLMLIFITLLAACKADNSVRKGDQYYALGEYYEAASYYKKAYTQTPPKEREKRGERALKMADCYQRIGYASKAAGAYTNALRYNATDSMLYFNLAEAQRFLGDYKHAYDNYVLQLERTPLHQRSIVGRESCTDAPLWKQNPNRYTVKKMDLFNSRRADYSPVLYGDHCEQIYLSSTRPQAKGDDLSGITGTKNGDIFRAKKDEKGKWQSVETIEGELNSDFDEGACAFTPDQKTMYLTRCETDPSYPRYAQIYTSQRSDANWSKPKLLEITKDTLSSFAHPAISPDGQWLYFVSDMPGGYGGMDIWRTRLTSHGTAGVENLGPVINTEGDEVFPTFRPNGELYFSSNGHGGMGGLDIFKAVCDSIGDWTIENLQYPMNSSADDFGMTFEGLHNQGYFSSNRNDGKGWDHIYSFYCPEILQTVKGWVYEKDGYELPQAVVYMVGDDGTNLKISVKGDGSFTQEIKPGVQYVMLGTCQGYLNQKQEISVEPADESEEYVLQFPLASASAPVWLHNVFYEFDKANLTPESTQELDNLANLLHQNPNITIELSAHCDYRGNEQYNLLLSQRRAEAVVRYLQSKHIPKDRLKPQGYGKLRPKIITRKLAEQYKFLHDNDTLTEAYIKKLAENEQEICNSLNRRTEFKVLRTTYGQTEEEAAAEAAATAAKEKEEAEAKEKAEAEAKQKAASKGKDESAKGKDESSKGKDESSKGKDALTNTKANNASKATDKTIKGGKNTDTNNVDKIQTKGNAQTNSNAQTNDVKADVKADSTQQTAAQKMLEARKAAAQKAAEARKLAAQKANEARKAAAAKAAGSQTTAADKAATKAADGSTSADKTTATKANDGSTSAANKTATKAADGSTSAQKTATTKANDGQTSAADGSTSAQKTVATKANNSQTSAADKAATKAADGQTTAQKTAATKANNSQTTVADKAATKANDDQTSAQKTEPTKANTVLSKEEAKQKAKQEKEAEKLAKKQAKEQAKQAKEQAKQKAKEEAEKKKAEKGSDKPTYSVRQKQRNTSSKSSADKKTSETTNADSKLKKDESSAATNTSQSAKKENTQSATTKTSVEDKKTLREKERALREKEQAQREKEKALNEKEKAQLKRQEEMEKRKAQQQKEKEKMLQKRQKEQEKAKAKAEKAKAKALAEREKLKAKREREKEKLNKQREAERQKALEKRK